MTHENIADVVRTPLTSYWGIQEVDRKPTVAGLYAPVLWMPAMLQDLVPNNPTLEGLEGFAQMRMNYFTPIPGSVSICWEDDNHLIAANENYEESTFTVWGFSKVLGEVIPLVDGNTRHQYSVERFTVEQIVHKTVHSYPEYLELQKRYKERRVTSHVLQ